MRNRIATPLDAKLLERADNLTLDLERLEDGPGLVVHYELSGDLWVCDELDGPDDSQSFLDVLAAFLRSAKEGRR